MGIRGDMLEQRMERDYSLLLEPPTRYAALAAALGTPSIPPSTAEPIEPVSVTVEDDLQAMLVRSLSAGSASAASPSPAARPSWWPAREIALRPSRTRPSRRCAGWG